MSWTKNRYIATPTVRDLWVAICIGEWQQMSVLLKKWPKSDGYCCLVPWAELSRHKKQIWQSVNQFCLDKTNGSDISNLNWLFYARKKNHDIIETEPRVYSRSTSSINLKLKCARPGPVGDRRIRAFTSAQLRSPSEARHSHGCTRYTLPVFIHAWKSSCQARPISWPNNTKIMSYISYLSTIHPCQRWHG